MISGSITFTNCKTMGDVEAAIDDAKRLILEEYTSGGNRNDSGGYQISVSGEEEEDADDENVPAFGADLPD